MEDEVDEELAFHLDMRTRDYESRGFSPADARRLAESHRHDVEPLRRSLQTLGHERDAHMQRTQYFGELRQDVIFALRQLTKVRGFAAIAIFTLALGIGGTTAIFSALYAVVLKPLPLDEPSRLFAVGETFQGSLSSMSAGIYVDAEAATGSVFDGLAAENYASFNLSAGPTPERLVGGRVTANYFAVMGARPLVGRTFTRDEDQPGSERVAVLSYRLWMRRFGGAPLVGNGLRLNGVEHTVIGVMPPAFDLTTGTEELWTPIAFTPARRRLHDEHYLSIYGRLKPHVSPEQALTALEAAAVPIRRDFPTDAGHLKFSIAPYQDQFVGNYRSRLFLLMAAVGVVLLIACGNVANLLLARGAGRRREIAIRAAIGAGRWRIVRQLVTESLVLGAIAALVGVVLAHGAVRAIVAASPPGIPRLEQAAVDPAVLLFAVGVALASSLLCGLAPALRLAHAESQSGLHDNRRGTTGGGFRDRVRAGLIAAEVALSLVLLVGAGLLIRSAIAMQRVDVGFDAAGLLAGRFSLPEQTYADPLREADALRRIGEAAREVPGVSAAAVSSFAAMGPGGGQNGLIPEGRDRSQMIVSVLRLTTPQFFPAMRTAIVKGRAFDDTDRAGGQKVMIVSAALAARAFPGQDPIGRRIACCEQMADGSPSWKVVVGVAADIRSRGPNVEPGPEFYLPLDQAPRDAWNWFRTFYLIVRTNGDPQLTVEPLRAAVARIDPDVPLFDVRTMDQRLAGTLATARFNTLLLSILGAIGAVLAATGIYGVVTYLVSQRTQEIGVRMALGATRGSVVRFVLRQSMKPVAIGAFIGLAASLAATRTLETQLYRVKSYDPATMVIVAAVLMAIALGASVIPARRAASIDPTRALAAE